MSSLLPTLPGSYATGYRVHVWAGGNCVLLLALLNSWAHRHVALILMRKFPSGFSSRFIEPVLWLQCGYSIFAWCCAETTPKLQAQLAIYDTDFGPFHVLNVGAVVADGTLFSCFAH